MEKLCRLCGYKTEDLKDVIEDGNNTASRIKEVLRINVSIFRKSTKY